MNGQSVNILLTIIAGLLGLVNVLFGLLLKTHKDQDDERWRELKNSHTEAWEEVRSEIVRLRTRVHDLSASVGKVDQWQRFHDEGDK